jgi:hypothetical protein
MTVVKSLILDKDTDIGLVKGYPHRVHRSKKGRVKDAAGKRQRRLIVLLAKGRKQKFNPHKILRDLCV